MPQCLIELTNIISNVAVAVAAILGIIGLWKWRTELIGKTKFETARKMTLLALQFRDEYGRARNAWTSPGEWGERKKGDDEKPDESKVLDEYFARYQRLQPLQDTLRKFYEVSWEAEVILSEVDANLVQLFEDLFQELFIAMEFYFDEQLKRAKRPSGKADVDYDQMKNWRKIIYGFRGDEVSKAADNAADKVKKQLKKYIR